MVKPKKKKRKNRITLAGLWETLLADLPPSERHNRTRVDCYRAAFLSGAGSVLAQVLDDRRPNFGVTEGGYLSLDRGQVTTLLGMNREVTEFIEAGEGDRD